MSEPFYWTRPEGYPAELCSDEGWYQWTERGLVYLGTTAEISLDDIDAACAAMLDRLEAENAELKQRIKELRRVLGMVNVVNDFELGDLSRCPWCYETSYDESHAPDCPRQRALGLSQPSG